MKEPCHAAPFRPIISPYHRPIFKKILKKFAQNKNYV